MDCLSARIAIRKFFHSHMKNAKRLLSGGTPAKLNISQTPITSVRDASLFKNVIYSTHDFVTMWHAHLTFIDCVLSVMKQKAQRIQVKKEKESENRGEGVNENENEEENENGEEKDNVCLLRLLQLLLLPPLPPSLRVYPPKGSAVVGVSSRVVVVVVVHTTPPPL